MNTKIFSQHKYCTILSYGNVVYCGKSLSAFQRNMVILYSALKLEGLFLQNTDIHAPQCDPKLENIIIPSLRNSSPFFIDQKQYTIYTATNKYIVIY